MNIAVVIGVSKYTNPKDDLPGCRNDADAIYNILSRTGKFDEILKINANETSALTKELLTKFISIHKQNPINEFFFYYSGHGEFLNDEFYYILSDFDSKKRNQSSLQNTELDNLIRTLTPEIVIKVIDSCQSGTFYIKELGILDKYFQDAKRGFKKCYFLNSSLNSQSSFADDKISFFTESFIHALKSHQAEEIRYKDIIDVISDDFSGNQIQTPLFVVQADFTERFCSFNKELRTYLGQIEENEITNEKTSSGLSIVELIKKDASNYIDKNRANALISQMQNYFSVLKLKQPLDELYVLDVSFIDNYREIDSLYPIKNWFEKNDNSFFVKPVYEEHYDEIAGVYEYLVGFESGIDSSFKAVLINFNAKYPNILSYLSNFVYFISKRTIRVFYFITNYTEIGWDNRELNKKDIKWYTDEFDVGDGTNLDNELELIFESIQAKIQDNINQKFQSEDDQSNEVDDLPF